MPAKIHPSTFYKCSGKKKMLLFQSNKVDKHLSNQHLAASDHAAPVHITSILGIRDGIKACNKKTVQTTHN
jgi:hypothetical protein